MNVTIEKNCLIIALSGEIDHHSSIDIKNKIELEFENSDVKNIIFDFSNVDFMDSSGVGLIIGRYKAVTKSGGSIAIAGVSGTMDRIMDISGIYKIIKCYDTPADALKALEK